MPLFLDIHHYVEGLLTMDTVAQADEAGLASQQSDGVNDLHGWFDETSGKSFCLVGAPNQAASSAVTREVHGLVADEPIEAQ